MSVPPIYFKGLLKTLAGQLFVQNQNHAECIGADFGSNITSNAKNFFSISIIEENLQHDLNAIGVLVDNKASEHKLNRTGYTFFIYIDPSRKYEKKTLDDIDTTFGKMLLAHEVCHFVYYYDLFLNLKGDSTSTMYTQFQNLVSGKLKDAIFNEKDNTKETVVEEHKYKESTENYFVYPDSHYTKDKLTGRNYEYNETYKTFLKYLNE